ncbi:MAG: outer membrane protein assembly factor BamD [Pseudomonadota bacterium]
MRGIRKTRGGLSLSLILILSMTGCFLFHEPRSDTVQGLFYDGLDYFEEGNYRKAREAFQELRDRYPLSKYSIVAELRIADCYYYSKEYTEAIFQYEEFLKLHPTNPVIPYVIFQMGMANFDQILSIDRDQTFTKEAVKQFEYLISRYPSSTYAAAAQEKLAICKERLSEHEFYVGHLYFKRKKYKAALRRFEGILEKFPESSIMAKTYLYIGKSHLSLEEKGKAKDALIQLVRNYPKSEYYKQAQNLLAKLK